MSFKETYQKTIVPKLQKEFEVKNVHAVPGIERVVVNVGLGRMADQASFKDKLLPAILDELALICGQKPATRPARKSIAGFKVREGDVIGVKATLRGSRMYDFVQKVITIVFPRVRDFKGIDLKNIDESGNLNLGFREHVVFPEINPETSKVQFGLQVTLVAKNVKNKEEALALYKALGFVFKK